MCIRRVFARRIVCGVEVVAKNRHGYAILLPCAEEGAWGKEKAFSYGLTKRKDRA